MVLSFVNIISLNSCVSKSPVSQKKIYKLAFVDISFVKREDEFETGLY